MDFDSLPEDSAPQAQPQSAPQSNSMDFDSLLDDSEKYSTPGQQALTGIEGAAKGIGGPLATIEENIFNSMGVPGLSKSDRAAREEANPGIHGAAEVGGFGLGAFTGQGIPAAIGKVGEAATIAGGLGHVLEAEKLAAQFTKAGMTYNQAKSTAEAAVGGVSVGQRLTAAATSGAAEMGALQVSNEVDNYLKDAPQSIGGVLTNVGLSALLGGMVSPVIAGGATLAKSALDNTVLKEFADRLAFRKSNIDPNDMIKYEADNVVNTYQGMNDEINGPQGLKAQAMANVMPEQMTNKIMGQVQDIASKGEKALEDMASKDVPERYINKFKNDMGSFLEKATQPGSNPSNTFDALNDFKKTMQDYSKGNFGPFAVPRYHEAYDFLNITKGLGYEARTALENPGVWGEAANLQKGLNASWTKALPAFKDFQSKFMTKIGDESVISSDKFNTYINQAGKAASSTDKQKLLGNFIDAMSNHFDKVDELYKAAGVENPFSPVGMSALKESLERKSTGAKLADIWHDKLSSESLGGGAGGLIGGSIGSLFGQGLGGAYVGKEVLGPMFSNLIKPLLEKYPNVDLAAFNQAQALFKNAIKGDKLLTNAIGSVFEGTGKTFPSHILPTSEKLVALNDKARDMNGEYDKMSDIPGKTGVYLPQHGTMLAKTTNDAVQYLNVKRPAAIKVFPLDSEPKVSNMQKAAYNRTLAIAQQPLTVIKHIKDGTLTSSDVNDLKSMYPDYYSRMSTKLMENIVNQSNEGKKVPYETTRMLSLFLGQPLDSTMNPMSIQHAQAIYIPKAPQQAQNAPKKKGTSSLGKANKTYQTSSQAAESDRSTRD